MVVAARNVSGEVLSKPEPRTETKASLFSAEAEAELQAAPLGTNVTTAPCSQARVGGDGKRGLSTTPAPASPPRRQPGVSPGKGSAEGGQAGGSVASPGCRAGEAWRGLGGTGTGPGSESTVWGRGKSIPSPH